MTQYVKIRSKCLGVTKPFQEAESNSGGTLRKRAVMGMSDLSRGGLEWKLRYFLQCVEGNTDSMSVVFFKNGIEDGREHAEKHPRTSSLWGGDPA